MRKILAVAALVGLSLACPGPDPTPDADSYVWYPVASVDTLRAVLDRNGPSILKIQRDTLWIVPQVGMGAKLLTDSNPPIDDSKRCPINCP